MSFFYEIRSADNTLLRRDGGFPTVDAEYIFFAGARVAQSNPSSGNVYYYVADHLGSTRAVTNASGSSCYQADFLPYGYENTPSGFTNTCSTTYKFTGYERDPETSNDYAFARYYSPRLERFLSPDPLGGDIADPQSLNKYTYVRNNPINGTDPSGLCSSFDSDDPWCGNCDPIWGCCDPVICGGGCEIGCGVGPGPFPTPPPISPDPPTLSSTPPASGDPTGDPLGDPYGTWDENLPGGVNILGSGGIGLGGSGCTYGSGWCGGGIYGFTDGNSSGWWSKYFQSVIGVFAAETFPIQSWYLARRPKKQHGPIPGDAPKPTLDPHWNPGPGWNWTDEDGGKYVNPGTGEELHPDLNHPHPNSSTLGLDRPQWTTLANFSIYHAPMPMFIIIEPI